MIEGMSHPTYTPRRLPRSPLVPWLVFAVGALTVACIVLAVLLLRERNRPAIAEGGAAPSGEVRAPAPPAKGESVAPKVATADRDNWTHKELVEYLEKKGLKLDFTPSIRGVLYGTPAFLYRPGLVVNDDTPYQTPGYLYVRKCKTAGDANDSAALAKDDGFAWGRFLFISSDRNLLNQVRKALP